MAWVIDTCVLIDILEADPKFGETSAEILESLLDEGLVICPMTYVELSPAFQGDRAFQDEFLTGVGADFRQDWIHEDTLRAHQAWNQLIQRKRSGQVPKRPLVDILIGAFATRFQGLITRNPDDFAKLFPSLPLRVPGS